MTATHTGEGRLDGVMERRLATLVRAGRHAREELISTTPSPSRVQRLCDLVNAGRVARDRLVMSQMGLVVSVARRYEGCGVPLEDLVQEGVVGLVRAVDRFDPDRGCRLGSFAYRWVFQAVTRGLAGSQQVVRVPVRRAERLRMVYAVRGRLLGELGREPSVEELAVAVGWDRHRLVELLDGEVEVCSLEALAERDGVEPVSGEDHAEWVADRVTVSQVVDRLRMLDDLERMVVLLLFGLDRGEPRTEAEVAAVLLLPPDQVRRVVSVALDWLRALGVREHR